MGRDRFRSTYDAGPFRVTNPHFPLDWEINSEQVVEWEVANTNDANGVNCQRVNIKLSLDGGFTYPVTILENTPNDGAETIIVPDNPTQLARLRVEAADNIFFDISNFNFDVVEPTEPTFVFNVSPNYTPVVSLTLL